MQSHDMHYCLMHVMCCDSRRLGQNSQVFEVFSSLVLFYLVLEIKRREIVYFSPLWISDLWDWNKKKPLDWRGCWHLQAFTEKWPLTSLVFS